MEKLPQVPKILTDLPGPKTLQIIDRKMASFTNIRPGRVAAHRSYGSMIEDIDGNVFLDFDWPINAVGYNHPKVVDAIRDQITRLIGVSNVLTAPFIECAEKLKGMLPSELRDGKIGYITTGSEAIDLGTRLARAYTGRRVIISFHGAHFGEGTSDCSRLAGDFAPRYKGGLQPLTTETVFAPYPYCYRCPFNHTLESCDMACLSYFDEIFGSFSPDDVAAVIPEGLPANSGVQVPPDGYLQGLRSICDEHGIMFLDDEVFSGFGKTGKFLAVENWDVVPDIVCLGKAMGGGLPISAVATRSEIIDKCDFLALGTQGSFSGNVVGCAASIATMKVIEEEKLMKNAARVGQHIKNRLEELAENHEIIGDVRGVGLMLALELVEDRRTKEPATEKTGLIHESTYKKGLLLTRVGRYGNILRMTPHMVLTEEQADIGVDIIDGSLRVS